MIQAVKRESLKMVELLYGFGFRIRSRLNSEEIAFNETEKFDKTIELDFFSILTKPIYIMIEAKFNDLDDPIRIAFVHMQTCFELLNIMKAFSNKIDMILDELKQFTVKMLDYCQGKDQIELFIGQEDLIEGLSIKDISYMPRVYQALQLDHREFIIHDNCQQIIRQAFFGDRLESIEDSGYFWYILGQIFFFPIYSVLYILSTLKPPVCKLRSHTSSQDEDGEEDLSSLLIDEQKTNNWFDNFDVPVNRLIVQTIGYFLFLIWIFLPLINFEDNDNNISLNIFDILAGLWALGYIFSDIHMMYQLSESVTMQKGSSFFFYINKAKKFFSNTFLVYRFCGHLLYFTGICLQYIGYYNYNPYRVNSTGCSPDDPRAYQGFNLVNISICLRGLSSVMIMTQSLQLFRLHVTAGRLYVAIQLCISIVLSFFLTFFTITMAFALGLHYIMQYSLDVCTENGSSVQLTCNDTFYMHQTEVGSYCEINNSSLRDVCPNDCWINFVQNPSKPNLWMNSCRDVNGSYYTPHIIPNPNMGSSNLIDDLDFKSNRFFTFSGTISTLFWAYFDPGHPNVVGCTSGITRYTALTLWSIYNIIISIILLNLLIAMMNVSLNDVVENKETFWKYHRTSVWMDYCNKSVILPSPLNLLLIIVRIFKYLVYSPCRIFKCIDDRKRLAELRKKFQRQKYLDLVVILNAKFFNELHEAQEKKISKIFKMERDLQKVVDKVTEDMNRKIVDLMQILEEKINEKLAKL